MSWNEAFKPPGGKAEAEAGLMPVVNTAACYWQQQRTTLTVPKLP